MGAIGPNDFPRQANGYGQASGDHASSRTDPEDTESGPTARLAKPRRRCRRGRWQGCCTRRPARSRLVAADPFNLI
jgi:hypothetical protein